MGKFCRSLADVRPFSFDFPLSCMFYLCFLVTITTSFGSVRPAWPWDPFRLSYPQCTGSLSISEVKQEIARAVLLLPDRYAQPGLGTRSTCLPYLQRAPDLFLFQKLSRREPAILLLLDRYAQPGLGTRSANRHIGSLSFCHGLRFLWYLGTILRYSLYPGKIQHMLDKVLVEIPIHLSFAFEADQVFNLTPCISRNGPHSRRIERGNGPNCCTQ